MWQQSDASPRSAPLTSAFSVECRVRRQTDSMFSINIISSIAPSRCLGHSAKNSFSTISLMSRRPPTTDLTFSISSNGRRCPSSWSGAHLGGAALLDWGYAVLVATLVQASMLALVLILIPLLLLRQRPQAAAAALARWRIAPYFLAIGFAFLCVEIASIQRFVLFLGHPVYAIPVVLCAFLFFAGLGSGFAPRLTARLDALQGSWPSAALIRFTGGDGRCGWVVRVRHPALAL